MLVEEWALGRPHAADIVGMPDTQLGNWLSRYRLFPEKRRGRGASLHFVLGDLMKIAAMKALVETGIEPKIAAEALRPHSLYGVMLHDDSTGRRFPGVFFLTLGKDRRWVGADNWKAPVCLEIRTWPIFDAIFPKLRRVMLADTRSFGVAHIRAQILAYEKTVNRIRSERGLIPE
jgi:hypothetical protein